MRRDFENYKRKFVNDLKMIKKKVKDSERAVKMTKSKYDDTNSSIKTFEE
jgi:hypothetical protein